MWALAGKLGLNVALFIKLGFEAVAWTHQNLAQSKVSYGASENLFVCVCVRDAR